jgi:molecular chaperone DnaK
MGARDAVATVGHTTLVGMGAQPGPSNTGNTQPPPMAQGMLKRPILMDVNPATLAIQTAGGFTERLLDKNAPIPIEKIRVFTTARDQQTRVEIDCCRGENRKYADNEPLGTLLLENLAAAPRGELKIEVSFRVDSDGILHVRATDQASGAAQEAHLQVLGAPTADDP